MAFLNRIFRNRGLLENLGREPLDPILEPIAPRPITTPFVPPQPVLPFPERLPDPFERLPIEDPRDDFLSIQRLDDRLQPQIIPPVPAPLQRRPQPNLATGVMEPVGQPIQQLPQSPQPIPQVPNPFQKPIIPPKRDDFMSIERLEDPIRDIQPPVIPDTTPPTVVDPVVIAPSPVVTPDQVIEPAPTTPAAVATNVGAVPTITIPEDVRGQVDPVLTQQDTQEILTDPLLRALYFGTADQPGFINQLQQATANLIGSDVPLQQTAGLSELEQLAQDRALADLGVAEPFVGESADLIRGTTRQFDPSMTQQFFNPFEDQVVQQTIQDVLEAGEKRDIAQRARDIQTGGLSAFGSRARLTAADRQRALGRGLSEALGGIRQAGFGQAQRDALTTFAQQRQAEQQAARDIGQVGSTLADLRARERAGLAGFGQTGRGIAETGLSRLFQQQLDQQGRPLQALQLTGQLLPQFQAGRTQIDSEYRLPADPSALGLGAAFGAYTSLKPPGTQTG